MVSFFGKIYLSVKKFNSIRVKSHLVCANFVFLLKICKKPRCFLQKFTQLAKIYMTAGRDGGDKSQLCIQVAYLLIWPRLSD